MAAAIRLPDMGTNVEECKILSWLVKEGDHVKRGEVLAEIETDKAIAELESTAEGVLLRQVLKAGDMARTGDILAYVGQSGEMVAEEPTATGRPSIAMLTGAEKMAAPNLRVAPTAVASVSAKPTNQPGSSRPVRVSPVVYNLAAKLGVDLARVHGSGARGMITREDVLRASRPAPQPGAAPPGEQLSRAQAAVARAVLRSWKEIPHLYIEMAIDMTAAQRVQAESETSGGPPSYDAIFLKAMADAIKAVPQVAAMLEGERVVRPERIHIALAVSFEDELFLPVVRDVDQKDLVTLQAEIANLTSQIRTGRLEAEQMTGGWMALSNLGMYPVESLQALIFPEHSTILALGTVQKKPVVVNNRVEVRPVVKAKLAADHRLINGRTAAEFLSKVKQIVESGDFL